MKFLRVGLGAFLALAIVAALFAAGILDPPEALRRRVVTLAALPAASTGPVEIERIPCPPLGRLRLYVICTETCEGVWRIVAVKGLRTEILSDLNHAPREPRSETRRRFNRVVAQEALRLGPDEAREMAGCVLRLDGMREEMLLEETDLPAIEAARDDPGALGRLAESLRDPNGVSRIAITAADDGYEARLLYLNTDLDGWPVQDVRLGLSRDGRIRWVKRQVLAPGAAAPP